MRDVAIVAVAQTPLIARESRDEAELVQDVTSRALRGAGLEMSDIGFTCSGSADYVIGRPFSFVAALDGIQAWPPISESHVEMDGAWALYEAYVKLLTGHADTALVYSFGKPSCGDIDKVLATQLDPYTLAPLWPDALSIAGLQAQALVDAGVASERDFAEIAVRTAFDARGETLDANALLAAPKTAGPLRAHDVGPSRDGAAALVLVAGDRARELAKRPAWIRGIDHRVEAHQLGLRDLTTSRSTAIAAERAGVDPDAIDIAELYSATTAQEFILTETLGLDSEDTRINPSGGALSGHAVMVSGLVSFTRAAEHILAGRAETTLAHAMSGPALQQNMVAVLEGS